MVYMAGDNELEPGVKTDIENELALLGSNQDIQVVVFADRQAGALLFHVTRGTKATHSHAIADWGQQNTGDPQTLINFVRWTRTHYPADHTILSLWGHGRLGKKSYLMFDATYNDILTTQELEQALPKIGFIDVVAFDACQMASLETVQLWHRYSTALSFSQEYVDWDGIDYNQVIRALRQNPELSPDNVAKIISESASQGNERTWSAIAVDSRLDNLLSALEAWTSVLRPQDLIHLRRAKSFYGDPTTKDLYDAASRIDHPTSIELQQAYESVKIHEWHRQEYEGAHGLSVSINLPIQVR